MRAALIDQYGAPEVVRIAELPRPEPRADEVRVRVVAAAVTSADARIRAARFPPGFAIPARLVFGIRRPRLRVLGSAFSGVIESVGAKVTAFAPGDEVCAMTGLAMGAHAEFVALPATKLARRPAAVSHEDAAGVLFGGTTALYFLQDKAAVGPGMSVLVNGASGAIGTNAVQLARHFGATVTGVTSGANSEWVRSLGAERVIDYTRTDLGSVSERFDVVLDTVGNLSIESGRRLLTDNGRLLLAVAGLGETIRARGNVAAGAAPERVADFERLLQLVADGKLTVVHDQIFDLSDIVLAIDVSTAAASAATSSSGRDQPASQSPGRDRTLCQRLQHSPLQEDDRVGQEGQPTHGEDQRARQEPAEAADVHHGVREAGIEVDRCASGGHRARHAHRVGHQHHRGKRSEILDRVQVRPVGPVDPIGQGRCRRLPVRFGCQLPAR